MTDPIAQYHKDMQPALKLRTDKERKAYLDGFKSALRVYAWWMEGVQYVGGGDHTKTLKSDKVKTLKEALFLVDNPGGFAKEEDLESLREDSP